MARRRTRNLTRDFRQRILDRDGGNCVKCGVLLHLDGPMILEDIRMLGYAKLTLDHIIPRSLFGQSKWDNLQSMCAPCNQYKSDTVE